MSETDDDSETESIYNKLLSGTPVYSHIEISSTNTKIIDDKLVGIIYNNDDNITIIPIISILKLLIKGNKLDNIFIFFQYMIF